MTSTTSPDRSAKADKVRALLAKTVANGCTEEEENAAALLAERLMTKYGLTRDECAPRVTRRTSWFQPPTESPEQAAQRAADRQAEAQRRYREAGVHIDGPGVVHPDCRCRACKPSGACRHTWEAGLLFDSNFVPQFVKRCTKCGAKEDYFDPNSDPSTAAGPRTSSRRGSGRARANGPHANCTHEATSAARARCRKERGF